MKSIQYKGISYESYVMLCKKLDIPYTIFMSKLKQFGSIDEAIVHIDENKREVVYKGKKYQNLSSLCKELDISYSCLQYYKNKGLPIDEIIEKNIKNKRSIQYLGETYKSYQSLCRDLNIPYPSFLASLKTNNGDIVQAIKDASLKSHSKKRRLSGDVIIYGGTSYPNFSEAIKALGIKPSHAWNYKKTHTCTDSEIIEVMMNNPEHMVKKREDIIIKGKYYPTQAAASEAFGVPLISIHSKMQRQNISFSAALVGLIEKKDDAVPVKWDVEKKKDYHENKKTRLKDLVAILNAAGYKPSEPQKDTKEGVEYTSIKTVVCGQSLTIDIFYKVYTHLLFCEIFKIKHNGCEPFINEWNRKYAMCTFVAWSKDTFSVTRTRCFNRKADAVDFVRELRIMVASIAEIIK